MEQGLQGQMSMFEMLGETGTPVIPAEEQKARRENGKARVDRVSD